MKFSKKTEKYEILEKKKKQKNIKYAWKECFSVSNLSLNSYLATKSTLLQKLNCFWKLLLNLLFFQRVKFFVFPKSKVWFWKKVFLEKLLKSVFKLCKYFGKTEFCFFTFKLCNIWLKVESLTIIWESSGNFRLWWLMSTNSDGKLSGDRRHKLAPRSCNHSSAPNDDLIIIDRQPMHS